MYLLKIWKILYEKTITTISINDYYECSRIF